MDITLVPAVIQIAVLALSWMDPPSGSAQAPEVNSPVTLPEISVEKAIRSALSAMDRLNTLQDGDSALEVPHAVQQSFNVLTAKEPSNPWQLFLSARLMQFSGRNADGIDQLRKFLDTPQGRNEWRAHKLLGDLFVEEYPRLAKTSYEKALVLNPKDPGTLAGLSLSASKLGDGIDALRFAQEAVAADERRTIRFLALYARVLAAQKKWSQSLQEATAALKLAEGMAEADPGSKARLNVLNVQYDLITEILRAIIREKGTDIAEESLRLAAYLREQTELQSRLALHQIAGVLSSAVEKTEPNPPLKLLEQYAALLTEIGRTDDAIVQWERVLSKEPSHATAQERLARLKASPSNEK